MDQPIGLVRDNPFVKNDLCMRARSLPNSLSRRPAAAAFPKAPASNGTLSGGLAVLRTSRSVDYPKGVEKSSAVKGTMDDADFDTVSTGSGSELEYGPGIVERLKAKFHRLSGLVSRDAKVSPHATGKRCPSVDDILSTAEEEPLRSHTALSARSTTPLSPLSRQQSQSTGDMLDAVDERRTFVVHRTMNIQPDEYPDSTSISALRRKFEINVQRRPSQNLRHAKSLGASNYESRVRPTSADLSHHSTSILFNKDVPPPRGLRLVEAPPKSSPSPTADQIGHTVSMLIPSNSEAEEPKQASRYAPIASERLTSAAAPQTFKVLESKSEPSYNDQRKPFRVLEVLNRAAAPKIVDNNNDDEPEFIKIGRRLRRNSMHLEELEPIRDYPKEQEYRESHKDAPQKMAESLEFQRSAVQKVPFTRRTAEIPRLSSSASIVHDDFYEDSRHEASSLTRSLDLVSPPDPDSARQRPSPSTDSIPTVFVCTDDLPPTTDASPPPEEPRPPQELQFIDESNDYIPKAHVSEVRPSALPLLSSPQIIPHNSDDSGVTEMQRLLNRFRKSRDERHLETIKALESTEMVLAPEPAQVKQAQQRPFVHAIVGVRPSSGSTDRSLFVHRAMNLSRPNVVNISVRSDAATSQTRKYDDSVEVSPTVSSAVKRIAPAPPVSWSPSAQNDVPRKSLSAKYIEEKSRILSPESRDKPYGDEFTDLKPAPQRIFESEQNQRKVPSPNYETFSELAGESMSLPKLKNTETSSSESEDEELPVCGRTVPSDLETVLIAGDGNPVRHSLLSLVMEEDIPALMEAMSERFTCEFEDLDESRPSTSSILHPPETRKERRKARQVSSIRFEETSPKVYTYLDELSAIDKNKWVEGVHVDYETYQNIIASEVEEYKKSMAELQKWKESIAAQAAEVGLTHEDEDYGVGVNTRFDYPSTHNDNSTMSVPLCA